VSDIEEAIDELKPYSGTSVNDIPSLVLKLCKHQLSYPIAFLEEVNENRKSPA